MNIKNREFDVLAIPSADTKLWPLDLVDYFFCAFVHDREIGAPTVIIIMLLDQMRFAVVKKSYNAASTMALFIRI